jgi:hypothetical protein
VELYRSDRTETEPETSEKLSNSPTEMVKFHHFLPLIKKSRYKNILIRTDNTAAMYNINKKSYGNYQKEII